MKQPRVPEYREKDGAAAYMKPLTLFLKDFSMAAWAANSQRKKEIAALEKKRTGGAYGFSIDADGHLICTYEAETPPPLHIAADGHLIYTYEMGKEA